MIDERKSVQRTPTRINCKHSGPLLRLVNRTPGTGSLPSTIASPPRLWVFIRTAKSRQMYGHLRIELRKITDTPCEPKPYYIKLGFWNLNIYLNKLRNGNTNFTVLFSEIIIQLGNSYSHHLYECPAKTQITLSICIVSSES